MNIDGIKNAERAEVRREAAHLLRALSGENPPSMITVVDGLIRDAYSSGASDLHILPGRTSIQVRMRIDGQMHDTYAVPLSVHAEFIARLKILAGIRIDEHLAAHDGRFRFAVDDARAIDVRVSIAPTFYGENAVLRILSLEQHVGTLEELGFTAEDAELLHEAISRPHGLILATGATGSGKTTTLYTLITLLADTHRAIVTIEDPIEYSIDGASQMAVNPQSGFTFAHGLRSIVRQDPDVIMVGEIRDTEAARLACTAALTGHLVLSTMHARNATTALARLRDLGVEEYLITSSVSVIISQQLIPRACNTCFTKGCAACSGTGYAGRIGMYDVVPVEHT